MKHLKPESWVDWLWLAVACGTAVATAAGFFGELFWILDLFAHFRVQLFQFCLILTAIALWRKHGWHIAIALLLACINYSVVLPFYFGASPDSPRGEPVRAMLMNLNASNGNADRVLDAIGSADPDLLLLEEVTPKWAEELRVLDKVYPHRIARPQNDNFGIMLLSRFPLSRGTVMAIGRAALPSIVTTVHLPRRDISLIGTHTLPPVNWKFSAFRDNQLGTLPQVVHEQWHPVLLMGDLNLSPWSTHFTTLLENANLKNSMKGFGFQPSWPAERPFFRIPIDHVLHSSDIVIHNRLVGRSVGSDHFPVIVDFTVR